MIARAYKYITGLLFVLLVLSFQSPAFADPTGAQRDMGNHIPYGRFPGVKLIGGSCNVDALPANDTKPSHSVSVGGYYPSRSCEGQRITEDNFKLLFEVDLNKWGLLEDVFYYLNAELVEQIRGTSRQIVAVSLGTSSFYKVSSGGNTSNVGVTLQAKKKGGYACAYVRPQFYLYDEVSDDQLVNLGKSWRVEKKYPKDFFEANDITVGPDGPTIRMIVENETDRNGNTNIVRRFVNTEDETTDVPLDTLEKTGNHCVKYPSQPAPAKNLNWSGLIAPSCTNYDLVESHLDTPFLGIIMQCIEETIKNIYLPDAMGEGSTETFFSSLQNGLKGSIRALMALYIIFIGYQIFMGGTKAPKRDEWMWFWLKLALVIYFATGSGMSDMFFRINDVSKNLSLAFMQAGLGITSDDQLTSLASNVSRARGDLDSLKKRKRFLEQQIAEGGSRLAELEALLAEKAAALREAEDRYTNAENTYNYAVSGQSGPANAQQRRFLDSVSDYLTCYSEKKIQYAMNESDDLGSYSSSCQYPAGCEDPPAFDSNLSLSYQQALEKCSGELNGEDMPSAQAKLSAYQSFLNDLTNTYNAMKSDYQTAQAGRSFRQTWQNLQNQRIAPSPQLSGKDASMDDGSLADDSGRFTYVSSFGGWSSDNVVEVRFEGPRPNGTVDTHVELASNRNSNMYKSFSVNPNDSALLQLQHMGRVAGNADANAIEVWWNGSKITTLKTASTTSWTDHSITLPPTGRTNARLEFRAVGPNGVEGGLLDNIQVTPNSTNIDNQISSALSQCNANRYCKNFSSYPSVSSLRDKERDTKYIKEAQAALVYQMGGAAVEARPSQCYAGTCMPAVSVGDKISPDYAQVLQQEIQRMNGGVDSALEAKNTAYQALQAAQNAWNDVNSQKTQLERQLDDYRDELNNGSPSMDDRIAAAQEAFDQAQSEYQARQATLALEGSSVAPDSGYNYCDFRYDQYTPGYNWMKLWDTVDCKIAKYFGMSVYRNDGAITELEELSSYDVTGTGINVGASTESSLGNVSPPTSGAQVARSTQPKLFYYIFGSIFIPGPGALMFILGVAVMIFLAMIAFRIAHIYIIAFMSLALLVYISPITITAALFNFTKQIFSSWLNQIISFALQPVILFAYLTFMFSAIDTVYFGGNHEFDGYNQIKKVNGEFPDGRAMGAVLQGSEYYKKENALSRVLGDDFRFLSVVVGTYEEQTAMFVAMFKMFVICLIAYVMMDPVERLSSRLTMGNRALSASGDSFNHVSIGSPADMAKTTSNAMWGAANAASYAKTFATGKGGKALARSAQNMAKSAQKAGENMAKGIKNVKAAGASASQSIQEKGLGGALGSAGQSLAGAGAAKASAAGAALGKSYSKAGGVTGMVGSLGMGVVKGGAKATAGAAVMSLFFIASMVRASGELDRNASGDTPSARVRGPLERIKSINVGEDEHGRKVTLGSAASHQWKEFKKEHKQRLKDDEKEYQERVKTAKHNKEVDQEVENIYKERGEAMKGKPRLRDRVEAKKKEDKATKPVKGKASEMHVRAQERLDSALTQDNPLAEARKRRTTRRKPKKT